MSKLILVNAETGDQSTRWLFGTTLADSAIASNSLVRTKIYPESDDRPAPAADGPDGIYSRLEYSYNRQGQQTVFKDADGTTHAYDYDKLGNLTADRVTVLAAGLDDAVLRIGTTYDVRGLKEKVTSYDAATSGSVVNEVAFEYDSFRQLSVDKQSHAGAVDGSTPKVTYSYESGGTTNTVRRTSTTYPTSSRVVEVQYGAANSMDDHLSRVSALQVTGETDELVNYTYCGQAWQVRVGYPTSGVELKYRRLAGEPVGDAGDVYSGYDRFGRTVDMPWVKTSDGSVVERSQYGFDRNSRRTWQKRPLSTTQDQQYNYDALSQVAAAARGSLNLNATAISGIPASAESWDYDPTGNWRGYHSAASGSTPMDQHRVHDRGNRLTQIEDNPNNMILDRVGRIRQMAPDAGGDWDGKLEITWDAWSRIIRVKNNGEVAGDYAYDGTHRRITREVDATTLHSYYNDVWRSVEERKDAETTASTSYLWGARHRDDLVRRDRAVGGTMLNETRYVLMDYFNPAAITDEAGMVKERYAFSAFGVRTILNPDYTEHSSGECGMEFAFQGQFLDAESGLINYGYRYYSTQLGRWTCKDPIGEGGGANLYVASFNSMTNIVDYLGLFGAEYEMQLLAEQSAREPTAADNAVWPIGGGSYLGEEKFWEQRIKKLLPQARAAFIAQVNSWVVLNCGQSPFREKSNRIAVNPGEASDPNKPNQWAITKYGDKNVGDNDPQYNFGNFALDITTPVTILYKKSSSSDVLEFTWKTKLYLEDGLGYNQSEVQGDGSWTRMVGWILRNVAAPPRRTKRAIWDLEGVGACCSKL